MTDPSICDLDPSIPQGAAVLWRARRAERVWNDAVADDDHLSRAVELLAAHITEPDTVTARTLRRVADAVAGRGRFAADNGYLDAATAAEVIHHALIHATVPTHTEPVATHRLATMLSLTAAITVTTETDLTAQLTADLAPLH